MKYRATLWSPEGAGPALARFARLGDIVVGGANEWQIALEIDTPEPALLPQATALIRTAGVKHFVQEAFDSLPVDVMGAVGAFVRGMTHIREDDQEVFR